MTQSPTDKSIRSDWLWAGLTFGLPFLIALLVYVLTAAAGLTWSFGGEDGGDLATAMARFGVPHPTGYPLYLLLGRVFLLLSSDPARALNLASAGWGAAAAGLTSLLTYKVGRRLLADPTVEATWHWLSLSGGLLAGLMLAFTPLVWSQSVMAEVYSFGLALTALVIWASLRWWEQPDRSRFLWLSLIAGVAVGHHRTAIFTVLAVGLFLLLAMRTHPAFKKARKNWFITGSFSLLLFALGLLVPYLYILWRGGAVPESNWSNPGVSNLFGFWQHFSGSDYHYLLSASSVGSVLTQVAGGLSVIINQIGLVGIGLSLGGVGALWLRAELRPLLSLAGAGLLLPVGFYAVYAADNSAVYLMPALLICAMLAGLGFGYSLAWVSSFTIRHSAAHSAPATPKGHQLPLNQIPGNQWRSSWLSVGLVWLALILPALSLGNYWSQLDLSHNRIAEDWAKSQLAASPPNALLLSDTDAHTFALWYVQYVEHYRPDVVLIETRLLGEVWYRQNLSQIYPDLQTTSSMSSLEVGGVSGSSQQLETANPTRPVTLAQP